MITTLYCSKCDSYVEVTARVLHFPFVCDDCSMVDSKESEENSEGGDMIEQEYVEEPYLDHADATVENTNALFEQIEEQLAQANADKEALIEDVQSLGEQLEQSANLLAFATLGSLELALKLAEAKAEIEESNNWEDFAHSALAKLHNEKAFADLEIQNLSAMYRSVNHELGEALSKIGELKPELEIRQKLLSYFRERSTQKSDTIRELQQQIADLKGRSFFQKLGDLFSFADNGDPQPA